MNFTMNERQFVRIVRIMSIDLDIGTFVGIETFCSYWNLVAIGAKVLTSQLDM